IHRPTTAFPMTVVVDDQDAAIGEAGIEVLEFVQGGLVPVGIESEEGKRAGRMRRDRLLDGPGHQMQVGGWVTGADQSVPHALLVEDVRTKNLGPGRL